MNSSKIYALVAKKKTKQKKMKKIKKRENVKKLTLKKGSACFMQSMILLHCSKFVCLNGTVSSACSIAMSINSCCPLTVEPNFVQASTFIML